MPAIYFIEGNEGIEKINQTAWWFFSKQRFFFHQVMIPEKNLSVHHTESKLTLVMLHYLMA
jgi:hypothetical protein